MAVVKARRDAKDVLDIIRGIVKSQPTGKEIEITIDDSGSNKLIEIKCDRNYVLVSFQHSSRLFIDSVIVSDDIKPISKKVASEIESFIYGNIYEFEMARKCEDMMTGRTVFVLKRK